MVRCFTVASVKVRCFAVAIHQCQWFYGSLFQYSLSPHRPAKEIAIKAFACMPLLEARCFAGKKDVVNISFPQMITPCMFFAFYCMHFHGSSSKFQSTVPTVSLLIFGHILDFVALNGF